jgi:hypothetical protein
VNFRILVHRWARPKRDRAMVCCLLWCALSAPITTSAGQASLRTALLSAAGDSIRVGQYAWAEATLNTILASDPSDQLAMTLMAVAIAGQGDIPRAHESASRLKSSKRRAEVTTIIERFAVTHELRIRFETALKTGDVAAALRALETDALGQRELALARGALCVLIGSRPCLDAQLALIEDVSATEEARRLLYSQLAGADTAASLYGAALRAFTEGADGLHGSEGEWGPHEDCNRKKKDALTECRQELLVQLIARGTNLVEAAPLSRSGLEASLAVALLTEGFSSVRASADRMRMALGEVSVPVWAMVELDAKGAFGKKMGARTQRLRITADSVALVDPMEPAPLTIEPLSVDLGGSHVDSSTSSDQQTAQGAVWAIALSDLLAPKVELRQKISWSTRNNDLRLSGSSAGQLRVGDNRFEIPYPVGLYHVAMAYGEVPTRAVLRGFGQLLGELLQLSEPQIRLVDSVRTQSTFGLVFKTVMATTATLAGDHSSVSFWSTEIEEAARKEQQGYEQRREWINLTEQSTTLQSLFDYAVREEWLTYVLSELPRSGTGGS